MFDFYKVTYPLLWRLVVLWRVSIRPSSILVLRSDCWRSNSARPSVNCPRCSELLPSSPVKLPLGIEWCNGVEWLYNIYDKHNKSAARKTLLWLWLTLDEVCQLLVVMLDTRAAAGAHEIANLSPDLMTVPPLLQPLPVGLANWPVHPTAPEAASLPTTFKNNIWIKNGGTLITIQFWRFSPFKKWTIHNFQVLNIPRDIWVFVSLYN